MLPVTAAGFSDGCFSGVSASPVAAPVVGAVAKAVSQVPCVSNVSRTDDIPYKTILSEDFSLFVGGREGAPTIVPVNDSFQVIPDTKTQSPGWQGVDVYEAGGVAYLGKKGVIFTPDVDLSRNGGEFRVTFRMRLSSGSQRGVAYVQHQRLSAQYDVALSDQWQTITCTFTGGVRNDYIAFRAVNPSDPSTSLPAYIDDIVVEIPDPAISSPDHVVYDNFDGSSFNVYWDAVDGAEIYEVRLSTVDLAGNLIQVGDIHSTTATGYRFENLPVDWSGYRVQVRAVGSDGSSPYSNPLVIEGIAVPGNVVAEYIDATGFKAKWDAVPGAYCYEVKTYYEHTPVDDERFYLIDTDFGFVSADDESDEIDIAFDELPGWFFGCAECADGCVGIQGAFALLGYAAQIESPLLDLTSSGGKVSVSFKAKNDDTRTGVVVALYVRDHGDYELVDEMVVSDLSKNWRTVSASLRGGTESSIIAIIPTGSGNVYIDDLKAFQNVKEGVTVSRMASSAVTAHNSLNVSGLDCPAGDRICYAVRTVGISSDGTRYLYSPYSTRVYVTDPAGISAVEASASAVCVTGNTIVIDNPLSLHVAVYNLTGQLVASFAGQEHAMFTPLTPGVYIVLVGDCPFKVAIP